VVIYFVDIYGIVDHYCLNFFFMNILSNVNGTGARTEKITFYYLIVLFNMYF